MSCLAPLICISHGAAQDCSIEKPDQSEKDCPACPPASASAPCCSRPPTARERSIRRSPSAADGVILDLEDSVAARRQGRRPATPCAPMLPASAARALLGPHQPATPRPTTCPTWPPPSPAARPRSCSPNAPAWPTWSPSTITSRRWRPRTACRRGGIGVISPHDRDGRLPPRAGLPRRPPPHGALLRRGGPLGRPRHRSPIRRRRIPPAGVAYAAPVAAARAITLLAAAAAGVPALDTPLARPEGPGRPRPRGGGRRRGTGSRGNFASTRTSSPPWPPPSRPRPARVAWARAVVAGFAANPGAGVFALDGHDDRPAPPQARPAHPRGV